ncbi:MAG: chemotaxis protein CheD [Bdellovibrionales bacterium]|nr:chemotaxis protein CheD [Bdellovibrionales bacterium]
MIQEVNVHIGEVKIGKDGEVLKTILGSCVGIALVWRDKKISGLAHCLLPDIIPASQPHTIGRFVETAIPGLLHQMEVPPSKYHEIEAIVAGGGNMTNPRVCNRNTLVGTANANLAKKMLGKLGIKIIHEDTGGEEGRKLIVNSATGEFRVEIIPRIIAI